MATAQAAVAAVAAVVACKMCGLLGGLGPPLAAETLQRLTALDDYDMTFLHDRWVEKTQGLIKREDVDTAATELKRFFALHLIFPDQMLFPPTRIDAVWHEFILFTLRYRRFCFEVLETPYYDHNPRPPIDPTQAGPARTLELYAQAFGPVPAYMWGPVTKAEQRWLLYQHEFPDLVYKSHKNPIVHLFRRRVS